MRLKTQFNNQNPLFFVFTCVKNGRKFIEKLFDSLLSQTRINFVHYIYEDGSTEPLDEMVEEYKLRASKLDKHYEIIYEKNPVNLGLNESTKHCIEKCNAPYFIWIDCDNWVNNIFFEELEKTAKRNKNALLLRTNCQSIDESGQILRKIDLKKAKAKKQDRFFFYNDYPYCFFAVNKKRYFLECSNTFIDDKLFYNDDQVICNCFFHEKNTPLCEKAISFFLVHNSSVSYAGLSKDPSYDYKKFKELAIATNNSHFCFLEHMYQMKKLFSSMLIALDNRDYKLANVLYKKKIFFANENKIPKRYCCKYMNNFWWFISIRLPHLRLLVRKIFKKYYL